MIKRLARAAVYRSGTISLVRQLNRNRIRILMYHRFPRKLSANFDRQCAFLAANYKVISLHDAVDRLQRNASLANTAVMTVDDGYADMHEVALPILRKYRLPATLFVTTGFINQTDWMPGDRVRQYFAHPTKETLNVTDQAGRVHLFRTNEKHAADELRTLLKRVPEQVKKRILFELDGDKPVQHGMSVPNEYRPCTWSQLRELAENGIAIGAHTVTHPILSRVENDNDVEREIVQSKLEIENQLQQSVDAFAYPNGAPEDISEASVRYVRAHFRTAVTAVAGLNAPEADPYALLRLPCDPDLGVPEMARMMAGPLRRDRTKQPLLLPAGHC